MHLYAGLVRFLSTFSHLQKIAVRTAEYTVLAVVAWVAFPLAYSQSAHLIGAQNTVPSSRLFSSYAIGVDASGNVYINNDGSNKILKETIANGSYTESAIQSGALSSVGGIAVDASGNVYAGTMEGAESVLLKFTLSGGLYSQDVITFQLNGPRCVAVDSVGNVYVTDFTNRVFKETSAGGNYTQSVIPTSSLSGPEGLAVDGGGNLYIADTYNSRVLKETLSGGAYSESTIVSGFEASGIALDSSGNIYLSDQTNLRVLKETPSGSSYVQSVVPTSGLTPQGIAVDGNGNVYIADSSGLRVVEETATANFGTAIVGSPSLPISLIFNFDTAGTIASSAVLTQGATGLDFSDAGTGSCTTNGSTYAYNVGDTCTVDVIFTPKVPGLRYGAAVLRNSSGATIATGYVQAIGSGPRLNFSPGTQSELPFSNAMNPLAVAVDAGGNLYLAQAGNVGNPNSVLKETWTGSGYTESTVASGLQYPVGVAVDGAGNVYIADQDATKVLKESPLSGGGYAQTAAFTNLGNVEGVAVDGSGNVYIGSLAYYLLKETMTAGGYVQSTIATHVYPFGIAVDGSGSVYFTQNDSQLYKETLSGGGYVQSVIAGGFGRVYGVALDGTGNIYLADVGNNALVKETLSEGVYSQSTIAALNGVLGVGVDAYGNVFASSAEANSVWKIDLSDPPSLSFASTTVGATSSDSPQVATIANTGNAPLTFPTPSDGNNPSIDSNFSLNSEGVSACPLIGSSSQPGTLAAGFSCQLSISFTPAHAGSLSGSLVATDNNLNATAPAYASQTVALSGTATKATPTITWGAPTAIPYGTALNATQLNATASVTGTFIYSSPLGTVLSAGIHTLSVTFTPADTTDYATATATVTLTVNQATPTITWSTPTAISYGTALSATQLDATASVTGTFIYSSPLGTVLSGGIHTLSVTFTPADTTDYATATATVTLTVNQATPTITWSAPTAISYGMALNATQLDATASVTGTFIYSSPLGTVLSAGTHTLSVTFTPADTTDYATATATVTLTVAPIEPALTFAPITTQVYGAAPVAVSATSASSGAVAYAVVSGPATIAGNLVTLTNVGTVVLSASQAASGNYTTATATASFMVDASFTLISGTSSGSTTGSASVAPGAAASFSFALTPGGGQTFVDAIGFSATGLPVGATATFSPATIAAGSAATSVSLSIQTANTQTASKGNSFTRGQTGSVALGFLLLPLLGMKAVRRRLLQMPRLPILFAAATLCLGALMGLSGCAGGSGGTSSGTLPAQSYTIVVTAKDVATGIKSSLNFDLTVQ